LIEVILKDVFKNRNTLNNLFLSNVGMGR